MSKRRKGIRLRRRFLALPLVSELPDGFGARILNLCLRV